MTQEDRCVPRMGGVLVRQSRRNAVAEQMRRDGKAKPLGRMTLQELLETTGGEVCSTLTGPKRWPEWPGLVTRPARGGGGNQDGSHNATIQRQRWNQL